MPRPRRSFPADLKAQVVLQLLTGAASQAELCRRHNIKPQLLSHWEAAARERMHMLFDMDDQTTLLHVRIAELEQLVGRQALELEILKKASRMLPGLLKRDGSLS
jgi:transposase-like protein